VGSYQRTGGVQTNVNLWINPPASSLGSNLPPAPTLVAPFPASFGGGINNNGARAFGIMCQFPEAPSGILDDVRVTTNSWKFVTGGDPAILTNPPNRIVPPGNNTTFSVVARGTSTLSYQWVKDGTTLLSNGGNISGANTATLNVNNVGAGDVGTYAAYVTNGLGDFVLSAAGTLSLLTDPIVAVQPQNTSGNFSSNVTFQVTAGGTPPFTYLWHKQGFGDLSDGGNIIGSHSNLLTITDITFPDSGDYYVTVSNNLGAVDSVNATLIVADPFITQNPVPVTTNAGSAVQFHVAALGTPTISYQWFKDGNIIFDTANRTGTSTDTMSINSVGTSDQGNYSATATGPFSNAVSASASLTALTPASVAVAPRPRAVLAGVKASFSVVAGGSGPFTYQWRRNGGDLPGATTSTYTVTNAQLAVAGNYQVVISNSFSSITSGIAPLTVSNSLSLAESNLVIVRVGDGAQTLTINGSAMFLDQFAIDGSYVNTITIPDDGANAMVAIGWDNIGGINTGSTTGSSVTRSRDGRFMVIAGYNTNLNYGASLQGTAATNVAKGIGLIDSLGQYSIVKTTNSVFDGSFWRAAVTDGTNNYWGVAGIAGTYYFGFDAASALVQSTFINSRSMNLFNGDIYCTTAASPTGVLKLTGMPDTASSPSVLFAGSSGSYDIAVNAAGDLIYLTDQRAVGNGGGIQRWEFDGSSWNLAYTINTGFGNNGPRYIAADFSGANPVLYVTSNDQTFDNNRLMKIIDTGAGSAPTVLASAGANQTFRGLHFGPVPNTVLPRPTISFQQSGNNLILTWTGSFALMSSTNVTGPYVDVSGATSPYTNNVTSGGQRFFGLRQ
jgi:hypothetical protein